MVTETIAWAAYAPRDQHIFVHSSTKEINIGQYVVFHVKASFPLDHFDWIILAKNIILLSGREYAPDIFSNMITFSLVVSSDMAPGFHIVVYTKTSDDFLISDAAFYPVNAINRHKIQFGITQLKDHTQMSIEATLRGDPGSVFMVNSHRFGNIFFFIRSTSYNYFQTVFVWYSRQESCHKSFNLGKSL